LDSSIARGFSSILALRVVEKLSGFVVTVFLFRMLEKEQVAEYGFIQTVVAICAIFGIQEFQNTISQSVARGFPGTYRCAVPLALRWSLVGAAIVAGFGAWYFWFGRTSLGQGFLFAAALFPVFHALSQWKGVYLGEKNFTRFTMAEASNAIVKAVLIIAVLFAFPGSMLAPVLVFFAVPAAQNLRQTLMCHRRIPAHAAVEEGAIAYGLRANRYSAIGIAANNLDRILIFTLLSPPLLAIFMAAEKFAELLQSIVQDLGAVLAPKFSTIERYSRRLDDTLKLVSLAMGIVIILFAIFALPSLIVLVFGPDYRESVLYAQVLVGAVAVRNIATLRFRFIRSKLDATSYRNVLLISSVGRIAASTTLIPLFGLAGAVASVFFHRLALSAVIGHTIRTKYLHEAKD
jgi:O-antigen/teichoic acid export membrane protein